MKRLIGHDLFRLIAIYAYWGEKNKNILFYYYDITVTII